MVLEKIKQIEKYNKKIIELEEKKQQIKVDLFNYVNNVVHKTNFFITTENKIKTYYYFMNIVYWDAATIAPSESIGDVF